MVTASKNKRVVTPLPRAVRVATPPPRVARAAKVGNSTTKGGKGGRVSSGRKRKQDESSEDESDEESTSDEESISSDPSSFDIRKHVVGINPDFETKGCGTRQPVYVKVKTEIYAFTRSDKEVKKGGSSHKSSSNGSISGSNTGARSGSNTGTRSGSNTGFRSGNGRVAGAKMSDSSRSRQSGKTTLSIDKKVSSRARGSNGSQTSHSKGSDGSRRSKKSSGKARTLLGENFEDEDDEDKGSNSDKDNSDNSSEESDDDIHNHVNLEGVEGFNKKKKKKRTDSSDNFDNDGVSIGGSTANDDVEIDTTELEEEAIEGDSLPGDDSEDDRDEDEAKSGMFGRAGANSKEKEKIIIDKIKSEKKKCGEHIDFNPIIAYNILKRVKEDDYYMLGIKLGSTRPQHVIITVLPIPPPPMRISSVVGSSNKNHGETDLTKHLRRILSSSIKLSDKLGLVPPDRDPLKEKRIHDCYSKLQKAIAAYINNDVRGVTRITNHTKIPLKSITQLWPKKNGMLRCQMAAKRVNFSARSVISQACTLT